MKEIFNISFKRERERERSLIGERVWSEVDGVQRMQKMHYLDLGQRGKKRSSEQPKSN